MILLCLCSFGITRPSLRSKSLQCSIKLIKFTPLLCCFPLTCLLCHIHAYLMPYTTTTPKVHSYAQGCSYILNTKSSPFTAIRFVFTCSTQNIEGSYTSNNKLLTHLLFPAAKLHVRETCGSFSEVAVEEVHLATLPVSLELEEEWG